MTVFLADYLKPSGALEVMPLPSGLPEIVGDEEHLARFLLSSRLFSANGVKAAAFLPNDANNETSVSRVQIDNPESIWSIGRTVADGRPATLHGAGMLVAGAARVGGLEVDSSEPPLRHANIVGWPFVAGDPALQKAKRKELAEQLASCADLLLAP